MTRRSPSHLSPFDENWRNPIRIQIRLHQFYLLSIPYIDFAEIHLVYTSYSMNHYNNCNLHSIPSKISLIKKYWWNVHKPFRSLWNDISTDIARGTIFYHEIKAPAHNAHSYRGVADHNLISASTTDPSPWMDPSSQIFLLQWNNSWFAMLVYSPSLKHTHTHTQNSDIVSECCTCCCARARANAKSPLTHFQIVTTAH